jgi:hypothetical protein
MEQDDHQGQALVDDELGHGHADQGQDDEAGGDGQDDLHRVEADPGGGVHLGVGVMDGMKAPEERDAVVHAVPGVLPAVQEQQRQGPPAARSAVPAASR